MKQLLSISIILIFNSTLRSSTTFVGLNSSKIVILEYWKYEQGHGNNEALIYNPTNEEISIEFKKYDFEKQNWFNRLFTVKNLFKVKRLKAGDYVLYKDFRSNIMKRSNGTIEVFINEKRIGLYGVSKKSKIPNSQIQEGILINQQLNSGRNLAFETIYDQLTFSHNSELSTKLHFFDDRIKGMGFPYSGNENPDGIMLNLIDIENLNIEESDNYILKFACTENLGKLKLLFTNINSKSRFARFQCLHTTTNSKGFLIFYLPFWIDFADKSNYI